MTACRIDLFFVSEILNKTSVPDFEFSTNAVCEMSEFAGGNLDCDSILKAVLEAPFNHVHARLLHNAAISTNQ